LGDIFIKLIQNACFYSEDKISIHNLFKQLPIQKQFSVYKQLIKVI